MNDDYNCDPDLTFVLRQTSEQISHPTLTHNYVYPGTIDEHPDNNPIYSPCIHPHQCLLLVASNEEMVRRHHKIPPQSNGCTDFLERPGSNCKELVIQILCSSPAYLSLPENASATDFPTHLSICSRI